MKTVKIICCAMLASITCVVFANSAKTELEQMAKGRISGITKLKKYSDGSIRSMLIIGRANFNKLMDPDDAEATAREDAETNASVAFTEYLNKNVSVSRKRTNTTKTTSVAVDNNGQVAQGGTAEKISVNSQEFASMSKAAIAGMKEIYAGVHNKKYVIIYAWDKEECKQLKDVILTMSETAQTAIKETKDAESRITAPAGAYQPPVRTRGRSGARREDGTVQEGGSASSDAANYL